MEGLFGIVVGLVFLISSIINKANKLANEGRGKSIDKKIEEMFFDEPIESDNVVNEDLEEITGLDNPPEEEFPEEIIPTIKIKSPVKKVVKNETNTMSFNEKEIIRGIIFKEVLDKPRAKKPYKPLYY